MPVWDVAYVLISVERLLVRVRHVPSRAAELIALRERLREAMAEQPGPEEQRLAAELRALKLEVSAALASVTSCRTCATGKRPPRGTFVGGDCCSATTADLFSEEQLAPLVQAGTRPRHLRAPRTEHAGCSFRGAQGCTLATEHRPGRCVHYTCIMLRGELRKRGDLVAMDALLDELKAKMAEHVAARQRRLDDEVVASLEAAITDARTSRPS